jgi:ACR3 family arsenite efflux pump ArsB
MFKSITALFLEVVLFPLTIIAAAFLWFYLVPEYWIGLTFASVIVLIIVFSRLSSKYEKYK